MAIARIPERELGDYEELYSDLAYTRCNQLYLEDLFRIIKLMRELNGKRLSLMDVGSNDGTLDILIADHFSDNCLLEFTLVDPNEKQNRFARRRLKERGMSVQYYNTTIEALQTRQRFDIVISTKTVHHFSDPRISLNKMYGLLRNEGIMYISDIIRPKDEKELKYRLNLRSKMLNHQSTQKLAEQSLRASYTLNELKQFVSEIPGKIEKSEDWFERWYFIAKK